jgi:hypothetical protein
VQYGSIVEAIAGQEATTRRSVFPTNRLLQNVQQAAVRSTRLVIIQRRW